MRGRSTCAWHDDHHDHDEHRSIYEGGASLTATRGERHRYMNLAVLILLPLVAYAASLGGGFVQDDVALIEHNEAIRDPAAIPSLFGNSYRNGTPIGTADFLYRPVVIASYALQHATTGMNPLPFHLVNVLLHVCVVLALFDVVRRLCGDERMALIAGALYSVHAAISEAVMNCSGRAEVLAALFGLLAWRALLRDETLERRSRTFFIAGSLAFLALLSKESAVALPGLVLLGDVFRRSMLRPEGSLMTGLRQVLSPAAGLTALQRLAMLSAVVVVYLMVRFAVLGGLGMSASEIPFLDNPLASAPATSRVLTALAVVGRYIALLVVPLRLSSDYSFEQISVLDAPDVWAFVGAAALVAGVALVFVRGTAARVAALGLMWFWGSLLLASNLVVPVGTIMAERLLYVPAMGFLVIVAWWLTRLDRRLAATLLGVIVIALGARTFVRAADWRTVESFNLAAVRTAPASVKALYNAGNARQAAGDLDQAIEYYRDAVSRLDSYGKAWTNLGTALYLRGRHDEAERALQRAVELQPESVTAHASLGELYLATKRAADAANMLAKATANAGSDPRAPRLFIRLAEARIHAGDLDGARAAFETALERGPDDPEALLRVARIRASDGERQEAVALLRRALANDPDHVGSRELLRRLAP